MPRFYSITVYCNARMSRKIRLPIHYRTDIRPFIRRRQVVPDGYPLVWPGPGTHHCHSCLEVMNIDIFIYVCLLLISETNHLGNDNVVICVEFQLNFNCCPHKFNPFGTQLALTSQIPHQNFSSSIDSHIVSIDVWIYECISDGCFFLNANTNLLNWNRIWADRPSLV